MYSKMQLPVISIGFAAILSLIGHAEALPKLNSIQGWLDDMPVYCKGQKFCGIPHEETLQNRIDKLIGKNKLVLFSERSIDRDGTSPSLCNITRNVNPMRVFNIIDTSDKVRAVVQSEQLKVSQEYSIEECSNPNTTIAKFEYYLLCQQVTMDYSYLVLNMDGTAFEMVKSKHPFPVYCDEVMIK